MTNRVPTLAELGDIQSASDISRPAYKEQLKNYSEAEIMLEEKKCEVIEYYRECLGLSEDFKITEDNIEDCVCSMASSKHLISKDRIRNWLLGKE